MSCCLCGMRVPVMVVALPPYTSMARFICYGMMSCICLQVLSSARFFFFNDTATTEIYTLSLHDALPIYLSASADAIANGVALRTSGLLAQWQERLRHYPDELAKARIEDAALKWGGFAPAGLLTLLRPRERLALLGGMGCGASRGVRIGFAPKRVLPPALKRAAGSAATVTH